MLSLKIELNRFLALGIAFVLSLVLVLVLVVCIACAQDDMSRAEEWTTVEAGKSILQDGIVRVEPTVSVVGNGDTFRIRIMIYGAVNLGGFQFVLDYDPATVEAFNPSNPVALGPFLGSSGRFPLELRNEVDPTSGVITYVVTTIGSTPPGPGGDGMLAFIDFEARALGITALDLGEVEIRDIGGGVQGVSAGDGTTIIAAPREPSRVSIHKSTELPVVASQSLLTYSLQRSLSLSGTHTFNEGVFDPIPSGTTYLLGSAALNGLPAPQLYSATLDAIHYWNSGVFTDTDQWTITFQVEVGSVPSGTLVVNSVTQTTSFDGAAYSGPYTSTSAVTVTRSMVCTDVTGIDLTLLTSGDIYTDTSVQFSADISPDGASKPYTYTIDYNDGVSTTTISSADPLTTPLNHVFASTGTYDVAIMVWNCSMTDAEAVTSTVQVMVVTTPRKLIYLPLVMRNS